MAYKNSDGNTSIANQWGQWRYFKSELSYFGVVLYYCTSFFR